MCDTIIATNSSTVNGITLFGKNSDREPNEAQYLESIPATDHKANSALTCTYIDIPQVDHTHAILISKPFWMWGAEMGTNEFGVTIGNEAVFTKVPQKMEPSLTGMDLLRLGLERSKTAFEALEVITNLLAEYGQGGNCGLTDEFRYHNSYIIADPEEAWVLETAGEHWAAKKIHGIYAISNGLTLQNSFDLSSPDLVSYAIENGWCKDEDDFDFSKCYSEPIYTYFGDCKHRSNRAVELLKRNEGNLTPQDFMKALRDHGENKNNIYPIGIKKQTLCMHYGFGPIRNSQTVSSFVSYLDKNQSTHFYTGTSAPCTSIFKPIWIDTLLPDMGGKPREKSDNTSLFWMHEKIHRKMILNYEENIKLIRRSQYEIEERFVKEALLAVSKQSDVRSAIVMDSYLEAFNIEKEWLNKFEEVSLKSTLSPLIQHVWEKQNKSALIDLNNK